MKIYNPGSHNLRADFLSTAAPHAKQKWLGIHGIIAQSLVPVSCISSPAWSLLSSQRLHNNAPYGFFRPPDSLLIAFPMSYSGEGRGNVKWAFPPREPCPSAPLAAKIHHQHPTLTKPRGRPRNLFMLRWFFISFNCFCGTFIGQRLQVLALIVESNIARDEVLLISSWRLLKKSWPKRGPTGYILFQMKSSMSACPMNLGSIVACRPGLARSDHMANRTFQGQRLLQRDPSLSNLKLHVGRNPPPCIAGNAKEAAADRARRMAPGVFLHMPDYTFLHFHLFCKWRRQVSSNGRRRIKKPPRLFWAPLGLSQPRCGLTCGIASPSKRRVKLFMEAVIGSSAACSIGRPY